MWSNDYIKNADSLSDKKRDLLNCSNKNIPVTIDLYGVFRYDSVSSKCIGRGVIRAPSDNENNIVYSDSFTVNQ